MELLLNLVWILLSVAASTWWWRFHGRHLSGRERRARAIALGIVLLLLFPVISMTDDLQSAVTLGEVEHGLHAQNLLQPWDAVASVPVLLAALCALAMVAFRPTRPGRRSTGALLRAHLRVLASRPPPAAAPLCA